MIKKAVSIVLVLAMCLGVGMTVAAQLIYEEDFGMVYNLADDWHEVSRSDTGISYTIGDVAKEALTMICFSDMGEWVAEEELLGLCNEIYADEMLQENLQAYSKITVDAVQHGYETYGGVNYFRYEKAYTSDKNAVYVATPFYVTAFITFMNGNMYVIEYFRSGEKNHFADVEAMLHSISFENGAIKIVMNGERIYPDSDPLLINDRTLVPIRAIAEKMGYTVAWMEENQWVVLEGYGNQIIFEIGADIALKNDEIIQLDVPAGIIGERTYLPLRAVTEAMDAMVGWDDATKTVNITY